MVAPVVKQGQTSRDIYLPAGDWYDATKNGYIHGGRWLMDYPAPLHVLPYFIRLNEGEEPEISTNERVKNSIDFK